MVGRIGRGLTLGRADELRPRRPREHGGRKGDRDSGARRRPVRRRAFYRGAAWVAGSGKFTRIDPATNRATRPVTLAAGSAPVFTQIAAGRSGLWATDYDRGVLYRIRVP